MINHKLHKAIGKAILGAIGHSSRVILDPACGGKQHIPIFCESTKSNSSEYCNVDALIILNNKINIIIEIEEANIKPTQICGKFMTSALGKYFIHKNYNNIGIGMSDNVLFIQVVDTSKLKQATSKVKQFTNIEKSINSIFPINGSAMRSYKLIHFNSAHDNDKMAELLSILSTSLQQGHLTTG